jgi:hypothetical protein
MNTIKAKFAERVLVPKEALSSIGSGQFKTLDGKICDAEFIACWDNRDGRWDEQLDHLCRKYWDMPFAAIKSMWYERCYEIEGYWHLLILR